MPAHLPHKLTELVLAAVYAGVGLTGDALQSVVDNGLALTPASRTESGGYFHHHAPDLHWHFHGHSHSHGEQPAATATASTPRDDSHGYRTNAAPHSPHACVLLSLTSTLKIGFPPADLHLPPDSAQLWATQHSAPALRRAAPHDCLARGPPLGASA